MKEILYRNSSLPRLKILRSDRQGAWLNIFNLTPEDLEFLRNSVDFTKQEILESLELFEIPRMERDGENILFFLRPTLDSTENGRLVSETILLVVTQQRIFTISSRKSGTLTKWKKEIDFPTTQRTKFVLGLLGLIVREYKDLFVDIYRKTEIQLRAGKNVQGKEVLSQLEYERLIRVNYSALQQTIEMIERLTRGKYLPMFAQDQDYLEDILVEAQQAQSVGSVTRRLIESQRDSYQIIFTNALNQNIQFLAVLTIALTIPTIVGSFWGMNVPVPLPFGEFSFYGLFVGSVILSLLSLFFLKKR